MRLYLFRHGLAEEHSPYKDDEKRALTEEGLYRTSLVAQRLRSLGLRFDTLLSSPLVRALQTADILVAEGLAANKGVTAHLRPGGSLESLLEEIQNPTTGMGDKSMALVGHEPTLSHWAELLVWGKVSGKIELKKAGVIGMELPSSNKILGNCQIFLLSSPRYLVGEKDNPA